MLLMTMNARSTTTRSFHLLLLIVIWAVAIASSACSAAAFVVVVVGKKKNHHHHYHRHPQSRTPIVFNAGKQRSALSPFQPAAAASSLQSTPSSSDNNESSSSSLSLVDSMVATVQKSFQIAQESSKAGSSFKQIVADVLAGDDYDVSAVNAKLDQLIASAPCVVFIWEASPFSKKAIAALELAGVTAATAADSMKIVRLDDPWSEGHPLRAQLGKRVGRTSVPSIWIGGEYVGGFDGGTGEASPGIVDLAFRGTLHSKLEAAGAITTLKNTK